jgi:ubiquinone/menaquinone biosynthesis C-methylase UbiE
VYLVARYDEIGGGYASERRADPRIAARIVTALGGARRVVNVGAGTGNYEPVDRHVVAIEPSRTMIEQRRPDAAPAVEAVAEALPLGTQSCDAAMTVLSIHHWTDLKAGLREMCRVATRQVVLTFDPTRTPGFWLVKDYFPGWVELDESMPGIDVVGGLLDTVRSISEVPIPADCTDGHAGAYWNRPEHYLDPAVQRSISLMARTPTPVLERAVAQLREDLADGSWDARHGHLRKLSEIDLGHRLIVGGS